MLDPNHKANSNFYPPLIGFFVSLAITILVYLIAVKDYQAQRDLVVILMGFGIVQALVQLVFFFQLTNEEKPRWNLMTFLFTVLVMIIIIGGSMWIMQNLNYNLMPSMPGMKM